MELVKDLPEVFEDFAEARQKAFLGVKALKDNDVPVVGIYCTYFPHELAMAFGASVVGLCSVSDETIPDAEKDLPRNLCPLIKSSYGFAKTDKCPFFYFSDVVVGETTCDGKKKMYELMAQLGKDVYIMNLPNSQDADALTLWRAEIVKMKEYLERKFDVTITEDAIAEAIRVNNENRLAMRKLAEVMLHDPAPITGGDLFNVMYGAGFKFDKAESTAELNAIADKIEAEYAEGAMQPKKPRILITGCPMGGVTTKVLKAVEDNGGIVVAFENCTGTKSFDRLVSEDDPDVYHALAERYLNIGCSVMTPNPNRYELMGRLIDEYRIDGVVEMTLSACHTYAVEAKSIEKFVNEEKGLPYLQVETDYSTSDVGQLNTRVAAFIEML